MNVILTSDDGNYRVVAVYDAEPESPRDETEFGVMVCQHPTYLLGDRRDGLVQQVVDMFRRDGTENTVRWLREEHGTTVILPLYLYDHSGLTLRAGTDLLDGGTFDSNDWDTSIIGVIFDTAERRSDWIGDTEALLRAEVEEYDLYLRGEVYALRVEQRVVAEIHSTYRWPDGKVMEEDTTVENWFMVTDSMVRSVYGEAHMPEIAADMLTERVVAHSE